MHLSMVYPMLVIGIKFQKHHFVANYFIVVISKLDWCKLNLWNH